MQIRKPTRQLRLIAILILNFFLTQAIGRDYALAADSDRLTALAVAQMPKLVKGFNEAESFEELFTAFGPMPKYVSAAMKTMLYELVPVNFEAVKETTEGVCASGYSWLLKKLGGLTEDEADIIARMSIWSLTTSAEICATKVLKKTDKLVYPSFAAFMPELSWDSEHNELGIDHLLGDATLALDGKAGTITAVDTAATLKTSTLLTAVSSSKNFFSTIATIKQQLNTPKTASFLSSALWPEAWAIAPLLVILMIVVVIILGVLLYVEFRTTEADYYADVKRRIDERMAATTTGHQVVVMDLIKEVSNHISGNKDNFETLVDDLDVESDITWSPNVNYIIRFETIAAWEKAMSTLARASANDHASSNQLLDYFKTNIIPNHLREDMLQASYRVLSNINAASTSNSIKADAQGLIESLKAKKVGTYSDIDRPVYTGD